MVMSKKMALLVAGLGNHSMSASRHSYGQIMLDQIVQKSANEAGRKSAAYQMDKDLPGWVMSHDLAFDSYIVTLTFFKPKRLMNMNGPPVLEAYRKFIDPGKIHKAPNLIVLHDELQKSPGKLELRKGHSSRGHKGLDSVTGAFKTDNYWKIGLGIGRPKKGSSHNAVSEYVLAPLSTAEINATLYDADRNSCAPLLQEAWKALLQVVEQAK